MSSILRVRRSLAGSVMATMLSVGLGTAWAQTPSQPPMVPSQPGATQPLQAAPPPGAIPPGPIGQPIQSASSTGYDNGFPTADVRFAVEANTQAAFARMECRRAEDALYGAIRMAELNFERSKDFIDAKNAEQQAYQDYLAARQAALKPVLNDSRYQANQALKSELGGQIADLRDERHPDKHAIVALSIAKLDYATVAHDMETKVLRDDSSVEAARKKLMAAGQKVTQVRDDFDMGIRTSPELTALRQQLERARINNVVAATYRDGAVEAANIAIDYAYYRERYNFYNSYPYNNTPIVYGSSFGYGVPIGGRY